jgi:hypothetical protein
MKNILLITITLLTVQIAQARQHLANGGVGTGYAPIVARATRSSNASDAAYLSDLILICQEKSVSEIDACIRSEVIKWNRTDIIAACAHKEASCFRVEALRRTPVWTLSAERAKRAQAARAGDMRERAQVLAHPVVN